MNPLHTWKIQPCSRTCASTGLPFRDGQEVYTGLYRNPDTSPDTPPYLRKDFSSEGWARRASADLQPHSTWQTIYREPERQSKPQLTSRLTPEQLLRQLIEEDEPETEPTRYILALMLERQKVLIESPQRHDSPPPVVRLYHHRQTGDFFPIPDPGIKLANVHEFQEEVHELLHRYQG